MARARIGILLLAGAMLGCSAPTPSPSARASGPTSVAPASVAPASFAPTPIPPGWLLPAGTYTSHVFDVPLTYTVPAAWEYFEDEPDQFGLEQIGLNTAGINIWLDISPSATCYAGVAQGVDRAAGAFTTWLAQHEGIVATPPQPVIVGRLHGMSVDVTIDPVWTGSCVLDGQALVTVALLIGKPDRSGVAWGADPGRHERIYVLDRPGAGSLVINVDACCYRDFDAWLAQATPVVDSFVFSAP